MSNLPPGVTDVMIEEQAGPSQMEKFCDWLYANEKNMPDDFFVLDLCAAFLAGAIDFQNKAIQQATEPGRIRYRERLVRERKSLLGLSDDLVARFEEDNFPSEQV